MGKSLVSPACPDCGTVLDQGLSVAGLCAHCLLELALAESPVPKDAADDPGVAPTLEYSGEGLAAGRILVRTVDTPPPHQCPDCGTPLKVEAAMGTGLCPTCLLEMALDVTPMETELLDPGEAPTVATGEPLVEGQIQGERYRIRSLLGRGGMGEVWRAYDLKLRQDVALKSLLSEMLEDAGALEMLRQEVRVAREVISPNVCRVFDLQEVDGQELVAMEYIDGTTLAEILEERSPLDLDEAREIASQFLAGLEAVHDAGLVHRDIKPENIMITRTGRVVVMDFGIAKALQEGKGSFAGTPAYMSPEQSRAGELDARSDVFSAGVVLAEMVAEGGVRSRGSRQKLLEGLHEEVPRMADSPWVGVIRKAIAAEPDDRFTGVSAMARALEEVTLRAVGEEEGDPYPGLEAFTKEQAKFFFGRELEVEAVWKKLRRPHLLAVIGPSGAGKSSFLRAGLLPALPDDWRAIVATPGDRPYENLAHALATEVEGTEGTTELLSRFDEPAVATELLSEWRTAYGHVLVIVDQFEELFTQNLPEVQSRFADLLGRLPLEADVHVLLSMRDDFLLHCQRLEPLAPVFSEMTPLGPPTGASLRRAIVQPALKCGYRFEDESLVESMLAEVEGERGALPMLAFAARQLWYRRDRDTGLLTNEAYRSIGGVGGALAQHAEAILEAIGQRRVPIVRELFRNLVTAQGTRAVRDRDELLSVFADGADGRRPTAEGRSASEVLDALVDARLLTSYETTDTAAAAPRIEIVHESLLSAWPRLVRWQAQDAEGAQLREELRNQAQLWAQHDRSPDYLWTGAAYLDYLAWRERYAGGLTAIEEKFARAMTVHAERRRRRRRIVLTGVMIALLAVLAVVTWSRFEAVAQARRAEASKLLAYAQLRLEDAPTEALAYTTASLEQADTEAARLFAARMRWLGPPAIETHGYDAGLMLPEFSPNGSQLAASGNSDKVRVWPEQGGPPVELPGHGASLEGQVRKWWASEDLLVAVSPPSTARLWKLPEGERMRTIDFGAQADLSMVREGRLLAAVDDPNAGPDQDLDRLRAWSLPEGEMEELGTVDWTSLGAEDVIFDHSGSGYLYFKGGELFHRRLPIREGEMDRLVGRHAEPVLWWGSTRSSGERSLFYTLRADDVRFWDLAAPHAEPYRVVRLPPGAGKEERLRLAPDGRRVVSVSPKELSARVWDFDAWLEARPLTLRRRTSWFMARPVVHPHGDWVAVSTHSRTHLTLWPLRDVWPRIVNGYVPPARPVAFGPDGKWLGTTWSSDSLQLWPLPGSGSREPITLQAPVPTGNVWWDLEFDPLGRFVFVIAYADVNAGSALIVPLDGSPPRALEGLADRAGLSAAAVSPSGRQVATAYRVAPAGKHRKTLRVWDLETGELRLFELPDGPPQPNAEVEFGVWDLAFTDESTLYSSGDGGILRWNLDTGDHEVVLATRPGSFRTWTAFDAESGTAFVMEPQFEGDTLGSGRALDLATGQTRELPAFAQSSIRPSTHLPRVAFDTNGTVAAVGDQEGIIRVAPLAGGEPHLLFGHEGPVDYLAISSDGRWLASSGEDDTLRLWPMPDLSEPPIQTLPREELVAKLKSLTNIRVVRDSDSPDGWKVTLDPFPGWAEVPTW